MKYLLTLIPIVFLTSFSYSKIPNIFDAKFFTEKYENSEDEREFWATGRLKARHLDKLPADALSVYLNTKFVDAEVPFLLIDGRIFGGNISVFYNQDMEVEDMSGVNFYKVGNNRIWGECLQDAGEAIKIGRIFSRNAAKSQYVVFLVMFDGKEASGTVFYGFRAFNRNEADDSLFLKYLKFNSLVRCLMFATSWNGDDVDKLSIVVLNSDWETILNVQESIRNPKPNDSKWLSD